MVLPLLCGYAIGMSSSRYVIKRSYNIVLGWCCCCFVVKEGEGDPGTHVNIHAAVFEDYLTPDCFYSFKY